MSSVFHKFQLKLYSTQLFTDSEYKFKSQINEI